MSDFYAITADEIRSGDRIHFGGGSLRVVSTRQHGTVVTVFTHLKNHRTGQHIPLHYPADEPVGVERG